MSAYRSVSPLSARKAAITKTVLPFAFVAAMVAPGAQADVIINFDNVANGTVIDNLYAGVTFSDPLGGNVYARNSGLSSVPSQVVSIYALPPGGAPYPAGTNPSGAFNASEGAVDVVFATPQGRVSIDALGFRNSGDALGQTNDGPFLEMYALVFGTYQEIPFSQQDYSEPLGSGEVGPWQTLAFTSLTDNIAKIRFSSQAVASPAVWGLFDNLTFAARDVTSGQFPATANIINPLANGVGNPLPEPATLALLGMALAGLAFRRRRPGKS